MKEKIKNSGEAVSKYCELHPLSKGIASDPKQLYDFFDNTYKELGL